MRPSTILEKRVDSLSKTVRDLTTRQREWGLSHVLPHHGIFWTRSRKAICADCGHTWVTRTKPKVCPHCGARLEVIENSRKRLFHDRAYYGIVQKVSEFTLVRIFYMRRTCGIGEPGDTDVTEILQHWIGRDGSDTVRARRVTMFPYYRYCPFSLDSPLSLKRNAFRGNLFYHTDADGYYPWMGFDPILKRNGFRGDFHGLVPEDVLTALLTDNRFETLWKTGRLTLARMYLRGHKERISRYWKPLTRLPELSHDDTLILLDYMELLEFFHKDPVTFNYPDIRSLHVEHDKLVERKRRMEDRRRLVRIRESERDNLAVLESKSKYFGITFGNEDITVIVLRTLEDYMAEGDSQHHCVFTNAYYGKPDSLILSARMRDNPSKPVETVEVSLKDGNILQCFGACNSFTERHQEILDLVSANSWKFLAIQ